MGFYKSSKERAMDVIMANASIFVQWVPDQHGNIRLKTLDAYERQLAAEEKATASARLAIDEALTAAR